MANFSVLIDPEHFDGDSYGEPVMGDICSVFFDKEGEQWIAFEVAELDGVFTIYCGSRFFLGMGPEEEMMKLAREKAAKPFRARVGEGRPA